MAGSSQFSLAAGHYAEYGRMVGDPASGATFLTLPTGAGGALDEEICRRYSARKVIDGSTWAARHAGTPHAIADTPASSAITPR